MSSKVKPILVYIFTAIIIIYSLFPVVWFIESSFRTHEQNVSIPPVWIFKPTLDAYHRIMSDFTKVFLNSYLIATMAVMLSLIIGIPAAYALVRMQIKRARDIEIWILSMRMAPAFAFIVPFYLFYMRLNLLDTHIGVALVYLTFTLPFTIWLLEGFIKDIPIEVEESAEIDGCSRIQILFHITLPLMVPGLIVVAILTYVACLNEFLFAYILTRENALTIPVAIATKVSFMNIDWEAMCAYATLTIIPIIFLSIMVRNYIARGLTFGAIKG
jgi:ABC-type glycerol-3-phosphate transport system permease component